MNSNFFTFLQAGIVTGIFGFADEIITAEKLDEDPEMQIVGVMISEEGKSMGEVVISNITLNADGTFTGRIESDDDEYPDAIIRLKLSATEHTTFTVENVKNLVEAVPALPTGTKIYGSIEPYSMEDADLKEAVVDKTSIDSVDFTGENGQTLGIYDVTDVTKVDTTENQYTATLSDAENINILFTVDEVTEHIAFEAYAVTA